MRLIDHDGIGMLVLFCLFMTVIAIVELWTRRFKPPAELSRKAVHITGGLGCLLFPFLIGSPWVVCILSLMFSLIFFVGQKSGWLLSLSSVDRKSKGSEYYPFAISFIFYISQGRLWLYFTSVLILTVSDAAAALIGKKFGKIKYTVVNDEKKSLEGSLVFFLITWAITTALLSALIPLPLIQSVLCAFIVAVLLTGIEAVSVGGTDNIFVPVLTCYVLLKITTKPVSEVAFQCISMAVLFVFLLWLIHRLKIFTIRDSILFVIFTYAAWSLGSPDWAMPIILTFVMYCLFRITVKSDFAYYINTPSVLRTIIVPLSILIVANTLGDWKNFYGPFLTATLISFILGSWLYLLRNKFIKNKSRLTTALAFASATALATVFFICLILKRNMWLESVFIITTAALLTALYDSYLENEKHLNTSTLRARPLWISSLLSAAGYYLLQLNGIFGYWI